MLIKSHGFYYLYWLILSINLTQARVIREEGTSVEEMTLGDLVVRHLLNCDQSGRVQAMVGGAITWLLVLDSIRR